MIKVGTNHFISLIAAQKYYAAMGFDRHDFYKLLEDGAVCIGEPDIDRAGGAKLFIRKPEGRYFVGYLEVQNGQ